MARITHMKAIADTINVSSLSKLIEAVDKCKQLLEDDNLWFRGHSSVRWKLLPTIFRDFFPGDERSLFVLFRASAYSRHHNLPSSSEVCKWLCLMRHYGLPTRLLDWTRSVLIAAHFALRERPFKTPCIWVFAPYYINNYFEAIAPKLTLRYDTPDTRLKQQLDDITSEEDKERSVLAVHPPEIDQRMLVQRSKFTIHGNNLPLQQLKIDKPYLVCIRIDQKSCHRVSRSLRSLDITDGALFPDLTHLAEEISAEYRK